MGKYDDIIHLSRPKSSRPSMPIADRAKIFMPFAALTGHSDAILAKEKEVTERIERSNRVEEE